VRPSGGLYSPSIYAVMWCISTLWSRNTILYSPLS